MKEVLKIAGCLSGFIVLVIALCLGTALGFVWVTNHVPWYVIVIGGILLLSWVIKSQLDEKI